MTPFSGPEGVPEKFEKKVCVQFLVPKFRSVFRFAPELASGNSKLQELGSRLPGTRPEFLDFPENRYDKGRSK